MLEVHQRDTNNRSNDTLYWWAPFALPVSAPVARDVLIGICDGKIVELEAKVPRERAAAMENVVLHDDCVLSPGFVNAHAHLEYAAYDALIDGLSFTGWIGDHMRRKKRLSPGQMRQSAQLGAMQSLYAGITCVGDASFSGDAAHAMHDAGLRGRVYLEVFGTEGPETVKAALTRLDQLPKSELLSHGLSPHAPYTAALELYESVAATGMPWMTHLYESRDESDFYLDRGELHAVFAERGFATPVWGDEPLEALAELLNPNVVAVHMTRAEPYDFEVIADRGAAIAHCPRSNARLGCGLFDLERADRCGVVTGLGTDSPASAGRFDPFAEMRSAVEQHRSRACSSTWPDLARIHRLATADAALALGFSDLGTIDVGAHADLIAVYVGPCSDPLAGLVLGATPDDVKAVLIGGVDQRVSDRSRLIEAQEAALAARKILALPVPQSSPRPNAPSAKFLGAPAQTGSMTRA